MPKAWVKNVYSLGTRLGIKRAVLSTLIQQWFLSPISAVYKLPVFQVFTPAFTPCFSTQKIPPNYLLLTQLYPQFTPPINTKKKKE